MIQIASNAQLQPIVKCVIKVIQLLFLINVVNMVKFYKGQIVKINVIRLFSIIHLFAPHVIPDVAVVPLQK